MKEKKKNSLIIFTRIIACNNKLVFFNLFKNIVVFAAADVADCGGGCGGGGDDCTVETELKMHSADFEYLVFELNDLVFELL